MYKIIERDDDSIIFYKDKEFSLRRMLNFNVNDINNSLEDYCFITFHMLSIGSEIETEESKKIAEIKELESELDFIFSDVSVKIRNGVISIPKITESSVKEHSILNPDYVSKLKEINNEKKNLIEIQSQKRYFSDLNNILKRKQFIMHDYITINNYELTTDLNKINKMNTMEE